MFMVNDELTVDWNDIHSLPVCASRSPHRLEKDVAVQLVLKDVNTICKLAIKKYKKSYNRPLPTSQMYYLSWHPTISLITNCYVTWDNSKREALIGITLY